MLQKFIFSFATMVIVSTAYAQASITDGCYQTFRPGSMNVVICVSGSAEEGLGGSGAQIAIVGPNGGDVLFCQKTSKISVDRNSTSFQFQKEVPIQFVPSTIVRATEEGNVSIGKVQLQYIKLGDRNTSFVQDKITKSGVCK